jgi:hypothetical protein
VESCDFCQIRLSGGHLTQDTARVRCQNMAGICGNHAAGLPLKERLPDFSFQTSQLLRNSRR